MAVESRDKNVAWFNERPDNNQLSLDARQLLENYTKIPPDQIEDHVVKIRNDAWEVFPYPCIGQFRFLDLSLKTMEQYPEILQRLQQGQKLLDMACCFGQEIRQLVVDGAPAENIYGCDLREDYISLGYQLFGDKDTLRSKFVIANIFDNTSALTELKGQLDIIYAGSFFHLWGWDDQVEVSKKVASLLRPEKGSMIVGRQVGAVTAAEKDHISNPTGTMYRHNVESFQKMWKGISADLGIPFTVEAKLLPLASDHFRFHTDDTRRIWFTIQRQ
jgi:hypothetical protein